MPINAGSPGIKSIQRGVMTIAASTASITATISAVNTAKSEVRMIGQSTPLDAVSLLARLSLNSSTQIEAIRNNGGAATTTSIAWEITEWY